MAEQTEVYLKSAAPIGEPPWALTGQNRTLGPVLLSVRCEGAR